MTYENHKMRMMFYFTFVSCMSIRSGGESPHMVFFVFSSFIYVLNDYEYQNDIQL
jgi:hypothetical protein